MITASWQLCVRIITAQAISGHPAVRATLSTLALSELFAAEAFLRFVLPPLSGPNQANLGNFSPVVIGLAAQLLFGIFPMICYRPKLNRP